MKDAGISQMPVMEAGRVLGLIEERDLLSFMLSGIGFSGSEIAPIVHNHVPQVSEDSTLDEVSSIFTNSANEAVLVHSGSAPTDIITKIDLIDYLVKTSMNSAHMN
jgi:predicted transcriptional regulator